MKQLLLAVMCLLFVFQLYSTTPKNFEKSEIENYMIRAAYWQLDNPRHKLYDWTNGAFYAGISAAYNTTHDEKLKNAMLDMGKKNQWQIGPDLKFADDQAIAQTYVDL